MLGVVLIFLFFSFFFFSSRRRHTRSDRDWSSDVCSSDLSESDASLQNWLPFQPTLSERLDLLMAQGVLGAGLIVVMPDCFTAYGGSQYLNSPAVGPYDDYLGSGTLLV